MINRRTTNSTTDIIGNTVHVGDIIAIPSNQKHEPSQGSLKLVGIKAIYLDDPKGNPYFSGIYFRDTQTGLIYNNPTDETRLKYPVDTVPLNIKDPSQYVRVVPAKYWMKGFDYTGINEIVGLQRPRLYGQPLNIDGTPYGRKAYYETNNIILVRTGDPLKLKDLANNR